MASSPKAASPEAGDPASPAVAPEGPQSQSSPGHDGPSDILPASHWAQVELLDPEDRSDADSARGSVTSSTASLSSSLLDYREILGRTYHHNMGNAEGWNPNDERHAESLDLYHYVHVLMYDGKLHMAPLKKDIKKVLDVGTGTGIWAAEFGDLYPDAEVIGTDVAVMQPTWVPPNVKFEIDNAEDEWTWPESSFDLIHLRTMIGSIKDWDKLYRQAFRCLRPGGWIEHHDNVVRFRCENGSIADQSPLGQYHKVIWRAGEAMGQTFKILEEDVQTRGMAAAGFVNLNVREMKAPWGSWPDRDDGKMRAIGECQKASFDQDPEGWVLYMWNSVLGWSHDEVRVYLAHVRNQLTSRQTHAYIQHRVVWAQKPVLQHPGEDLQEPAKPAKKAMMPVSTEAATEKVGVGSSSAKVESH